MPLPQDTVPTQSRRGSYDAFITAYRMYQETVMERTENSNQHNNGLRELMVEIAQNTAVELGLPQDE